MRVLVLVALAACTRGMTDADEIYPRDDGNRVLCGLSLDGEGVSLAQIDDAIMRAVDEDETLVVFAHEPGRTITAERVDSILALATAAGVPYITFPELVDARNAGFALGFDDAYISPWYALRETFQRHGARVTFFVSNYDELDAVERMMLKELASDGHAIEAHGAGHRNAAVYVERYGLATYLRDEITPLLAAMRADGYSPTTFAYPYGDRTTELDDALLERFTLVRSLSYLDRSLIDSAPCPR